MNRRILPFSFVVCGAILAYACSSKDSSDPGPTGTVPDGSTTPPTGDATTTPPGDDGSVSPGDSSVPVDSSVPNDNPILGIGTPTLVPSFSGISTEGPLWHTNGLYFSTVGNPSNLVKLTLPMQTDVVHTLAANIQVLGNAFDPKVGGFVSCEAVIGGPSPNGLTRTPLTGGPSTPIGLTFDGGVSGFDSPNDVIVRKDGTIYVTDPGYQNPATVNNHIWRVTPTGAVFETQVDSLPNGIALSPDEKTLYVSFSGTNAVNSLPVIMKYTVATDGTLGAGTKLTDVGPAGTLAQMGSLLDGLAVDNNGNVYAATRTGVQVYKPDGTKWGTIAAPAAATNGFSNLSFGGTDGKTLLITSDSGMFEVVTKVAGLP